MVVGIEHFGPMRPAAEEVDTEVSGEAVIENRLVAMRLPIHRSREVTTVDLKNDRPPLPTPLPEDLAHRLGISNGDGLDIGV